MMIALFIRLIQVLGVSALPGIALLGVFGVSQLWTLDLSIRQRTKLVKVTDMRVNHMTKLLQSIRSIKIHGWECYFFERLKALRATELKSVSILLLIKCVLNTAIDSLPVYCDYGLIRDILGSRICIGGWNRV